MGVNFLFPITETQPERTQAIEFPIIQRKGTAMTQDDPQKPRGCKQGRCQREPLMSEEEVQDFDFSDREGCTPSSLIGLAMILIFLGWCWYWFFN